MTIAYSAKKLLPARIAHTGRRLRFRLLNRNGFENMKYARLTRAPSGLEPFDTHKAIFVHIPKCAGTSVSNSLFGSTVGAHNSISYYQLVYPWRTFNEYFKFAFVRNPFDRLVSAFMYLQRGGGNSIDAQWAQRHRPKLTEFKRFACTALASPEILGFTHFRPQVEYLFDIRGCVRIDFVGRYENLAPDFHKVSQRLGLESNLRWTNRSLNRGIEPYQAYYDEETREVVAEIYSEDLRLLDYLFD